MNRKVCFVCYILVFTGKAISGIEDYLIYDKKNRDNLVELDAVVEFKVNHYFAFADPALSHTYVHERNRVLREIEDGVERSGTGSQYWMSLPDLNAKMLLLRHTVWVVDADIIKYLDGFCETNRVFIATKHTPAFLSSEAPPGILTENNDSLAQRVFGIVKIDGEEFQRGFRDKLCYLEDNLDFIRKVKELDVEQFRSFYEVINTNNNMPFYVARDIGIKKIISDEDPLEDKLAELRGYSMEEDSPLIQALKSELAKEEELMKRFGLKEPLSSPYVMERVKQLENRYGKKSLPEFK